MPRVLAMTGNSSISSDIHSWMRDSSRSSAAIAGNYRGRMVEVLDESAVAAGLAGLAWERDGDEIVKTVGRKDFAEAMVLVNQVAELAEAADHHSDIAISWNKVTLRLSTHSAGGITAKDLELAERIDRLG